MEEISFAKIHEELQGIDSSSLPGLNIVILRNITLEPLEPYLRYFIHRVGFNARIKFGGYDSVFKVATDPRDQSFLKDVDYVSIFTQWDTLSSNLARNYPALNDQQVAAEVKHVKDYIASVLSGVRQKTKAKILWHGFEFPVYPAGGVLGSQAEKGQLSVVKELNDFLLTSLRKTPDAYFVDMNLLLARVGTNNFYDQRYWHIGRAPYARAALCEIAREDCRFIRALEGKSKKCLVLDCDNILWGGIIGEDSLSGIDLGRVYPGSMYHEFQQELLNLYNRGVLLALCSKNNEEEVWEVFRKHPDMLLREEHIAAHRINWQDKASNIKEIAEDLNIGLESMVFIDDSEFEANLVRQLLPEVEVVHLPREKAAGNRDTLVACGLFDTLTVSQEDKSRGAMYKAEAARKKFQAQAMDTETYYKSLEMVLEIRFADDFTIPRIAQLTQRTNQFNLTTRRYSDGDIRNLANSDKSDVLSVKLKDRFGDSGIVGVCILRYGETEVFFDTFLLSCRILGRGIEDAFLRESLRLAQKSGCRVAMGEYIAIRKNGQVKDFYTAHGFERLDRSKKENGETFRYDLSKEIKLNLSFFKKIESEV